MAWGVVVKNTAIIVETVEFVFTSLDFALVIRTTSVSNFVFWLGWWVGYCA